MAVSTSKISKHQENITMLMEKLKELTMEAENEDGVRLFGRVEGMYWIKVHL